MSRKIYETKLALKMQLLTKKINDFNDGKIELDDEEIDALEQEKSELLYEYKSYRISNSGLKLVSNQ